MTSDKEPKWDCYPEHLRPSEPPDTERTPPEFKQELLGEFSGVDWGVEEELDLEHSHINPKTIRHFELPQKELETDPDCPECAYEKETGRAASVPHHCDQMAIDAGYYPEKEDD